MCSITLDFLCHRLAAGVGLTATTGHFKGFAHDRLLRSGARSFDLKATRQESDPLSVLTK